MPTKLSILLVVPIILLALAAPVSAQSPAKPADTFFFHDGDIPIVFLGDSITEQKMYTTLIETYTLTRFPAWKITFRNTGWSGDRADLSSRGGTFEDCLQRDVLSLQPKSITIDYGMNDARGGDANYPRYIDYTTRTIDALKKAGARVALMTPSPEEKYESDAPAGSHYNLMLKKYSDGLKDLAAKENVLFVDQFTPFVNFIEAGRQAGVLNKEAPTGADGAPFVRLIPDGIHPNWGGHLIMATVILQQLHAPALVSSASLNAETRATVEAQSCTIEWQDAANGAVQFKRTDEALPWPTPVESDLVLKIPGFDPATALNRYELKVTGLKAASYKLTIDDKNIATYSSADLTSGVNLSLVRQGPIYDQEQKLLQKVAEKNNVYRSRWRDVQIYQVPEWLKVPGVEEARTAEVAKRDKQIADDEQAIEQLRKPLPHIFKLEPATK